MAGFDYLAEVRRLGGLEFTPQTPEAWLELARALKRGSKSAEHARRIVSRFLEPGADRRCPTPADLAALARTIPADPELDRPELQNPCVQCSDFGGLWRMTANGLARCNCARGKKLTAMDVAREQAPPERKPAAVQAVGDWARKAAGDRDE